jgi:hypothetical protein
MFEETIDMIIRELDERDMEEEFEDLLFSEDDLEILGE